MCQLVAALVAAGSKAARLARGCRRGRLLARLVQRKEPEDANPRFDQDFKTLADVLIQETVRHDLALLFPELADHIHGEESNKFSNTVGETITVEVKETEEETAQLLCKVLNGDMEAANLLAADVHGKIEMDDINSQISNCLNLDISIDNLGIWIDPIDSTAEYISGESESVSIDNISLSGLECVTVLIGVYNRETGQPIIGVINQPFYDGSKGRCLWGISYMGKRIFCNPVKETPANPSNGPTSTICISSSEDDNLKQLLSKAGYNLVESAGAGYKLLMVILGHADAYILSKPTTFKWDTCGPHAILNSLNGGILDYSKALTEIDDSKNYETVYNVVGKSDTLTVAECCNRGGIIAYRNSDFVSKILDILSEGTV